MTTIEDGHNYAIHVIVSIVRHGKSHPDHQVRPT